MRTKNTCRYYCAAGKDTHFESSNGCTYKETSSFFKQKRVATLDGEYKFGKDNYIIIHWDFELPKKEGKK